MVDDTGNEDRKQRELRARLERLNRGPLRKSSDSTRSGIDLQRAVEKQKRADAKRPSAVVYRRDLPRHSSTVARHDGAVSGRHVEIEQAVAGVETVHPERGPCLLVSTEIGRIEGASAVDEAFRNRMLPDDSALRGRLLLACDLEEVELGDVIFMDVETCGLGSSPLFLIGVMVWSADGFEVRQYFARDYAEEAAVVAWFIDVCSRRKLLVTFNGKSFDFPFIRARAAANGIPFDLAPAHFDLLHECRRIWRTVLPDCRLQTLESQVCGRARYGDIPGRDIPDAYHTYVRTQNAVQMAAVLKHNMLDLVTLADLMTRFPEP